MNNYSDIAFTNPPENSKTDSFSRLISGFTPSLVKHRLADPRPEHMTLDIVANAAFRFSDGIHESQSILHLLGPGVRTIPSVVQSIELFDQLGFIGSNPHPIGSAIIIGHTESLGGLQVSPTDSATMEVAA